MTLTSVVNKRRIKWAWKEIPVTIQSRPGLTSSFSVLKKVRNSYLLKGFSGNWLCVSDEEPDDQWAWFQMLIITNQRDVSNKKTKITWFLTFFDESATRFLSILELYLQYQLLSRQRSTKKFVTEKRKESEWIKAFHSCKHNPRDSSSLVPSLLLRHSWISISDDKTFKGWRKRFDKESKNTSVWIS